MTLAALLAEKGFRISLIERSARLGGLLSPWEIGDYSWDQFYHVILKSDTHLLKMLDRFGLADQITWKYTLTGFFADGQLASMSNIKEFFAFPPLNLVDKLRLGITIFYASKIKNYERLEQISSVDWLKKLSGKKTTEKIWVPLLKSKLGAYYNLASASFIWATIARMYAARRSGIKQEMFGYVPGGYATILNKFQQYLNKAGIKVYLESDVTQIRQDNNLVYVETSDNQTMQFDHSIVTASCSKIAQLCPQLSSSEKKRHQKVIYLGLLCASLIIKQPLGGFYYTNITDDQIPFTTIVEMTSLVNRKNFGENSLVYLPRYMTKDDQYWQKSDEEIRYEFVKALIHIFPALHKEDIVVFKSSKVREIMPIVTLNYTKSALPLISTSLDRVFVVNSAQIADGTWNVNEIIRLAQKKTEEVAELI